MEQLTRKQKIKKYTVYALLILAADLFQNVSGLMPEIGGARCFLIIPCVIVLSMGEDERTAAILGLFAGLIWDTHSGVHLGFNCIFLAVACFFSASLITYIARNIFITNFICIAVSTILYALVYWLFFIIIKGVTGGENTLFTFYIPCMIYTIALSSVVYFIYRPIKKKLNFTQITNF